jgi:pilus assembly protein CpaE
MGLRLADQILLVAQLELASLRNVVRLLHALSGEEGLVEKVRVVINRQGAETVEEGISQRKAEEVIGRPIFWLIPNESKSVIGARVAGHPLIKYAPKSAVQKSLLGLSQAMYGKTAAKDSSKPGGWNIFRRSSS